MERYEIVGELSAEEMKLMFMELIVAIGYKVDEENTNKILAKYGVKVGYYFDR